MQLKPITEQVVVVFGASSGIGRRCEANATSPIYQPHLVADAILYAAEHPIRDITIEGAGKAGIMIQRISPRLLDAFLLCTAFILQRTDEPKSEDAPHNLFEPIVGYDRIALCVA